MNRIFRTFLYSILSLMIVACSGATVDYSDPPESDPMQSTPAGLPDTSPPSVASAPLATIPDETVDGFNRFSWKFYLANSGMSADNVCVSPLSVGTVLGMIANGDDGSARNEILKLLGFEESEAGLSALNTYCQTLISNLPNIEEGISCDVTNTLWYDPSAFRIREPFMHALTDSYYAYEIGISPYGESGRRVINEFVEKSTRGLIKDFLKSPLDINLAFLNTIYFKAGWSEGFSEEVTSKGIFTDINGHRNDADFMTRFAFTEYVMTDDGTQAIRLDYGKQRQFSMTCILPSLQDGRIALDEVVTAENISHIEEYLNECYIKVKLPKFQAETNNPETLSILRDLGLDDVGKGNCGFPLMTETDVFYLTSFIHAAKITVDEDGTEGAAASLGGLMGNPDPDGADNSIHEVVFDRPFIFYIQENATGAILFIGSVKTFP